MGLKQDIVGLYRKTSTEIPDDIARALRKAEKNENKAAKDILKFILKNIELAKKYRKPLCQDTGMPIFYVKGKNHDEIEKTIIESTKIATEKIPLRHNAVHPLTGKNLGNKPVIHFKESDKLGITLMLKGGGSKNISQIYKLPNSRLKAHRNPDGVKKCVLDAVIKAQGKGCPPYIIGVGVGGSAYSVIKIAEEQLLRKIDDNNTDETENKLERELLNGINKLGIGPMGMGGKTTALGVKIGTTHRHPACFFVGVSFGCWATRRCTL